MKGGECMERETLWEFKSWIKNFEDVDLPIGDFAKDVVSSKDFPDGNDYLEILEYVAKKSKRNFEIVDTFRIIWDFYVSSTS